MTFVELRSGELRTKDIESGAIIFCAKAGEYGSAIEFGQACAFLKDTECPVDFLIEPWANKDYQAEEISEEEFWERCILSEYLESNTDAKRKSIRKAIRFWDEWNNSFHAIELKNGNFCGIAWWTTA